VTRLTVADLEVERPAEGLEIEMDDGTVYVLQDPKGMQLETLIDLENMSQVDQVKALISDGKFAEFAARPEVDGYFFEAVMKKFAAHYGLGTPGEGVASLRSVKGTARPSKRTSPKKASA